MIKCKHCGREICYVSTTFFDIYGRDYMYDVPIRDNGEGAVSLFVDKNWTGYELSEEEQMESIMCPQCGKYPFSVPEIYTYDTVEIVCFTEVEE